MHDFRDGSPAPRDEHARVPLDLQIVLELFVIGWARGRKLGSEVSGALGLCVTALLLGARFSESSGGTGAERRRPWKEARRLRSKPGHGTSLELLLPRSTVADTEVGGRVERISAAVELVAA
jgi:hypothetical protein